MDARAADDVRAVGGDFEGAGDSVYFALSAAGFRGGGGLGFFGFFGGDVGVYVGETAISYGDGAGVYVDADSLRIASGAGASANRFRV